MPNSDDLAKAEQLAINLARGTLANHCVINVRGHYFAVKSPVLSGLALEALKTWLPKIASSFEAEFDTTGRRIS